MSVSLTLGTILRIAGLDTFMAEKIPVDLSIALFPVISLLISSYGLWRVKELKSFSSKDRKLYLFVSSVTLFIFGPFVSGLFILPFFWVYCQNNFC